MVSCRLDLLFMLFPEKLGSDRDAADDLDDLHIMQVSGAS